MTSKVFLFPDTNLFIQCKPLRELDWSAWAAFDEVELIVSRPVQAEIDRQKGGGNNRLAKRARATAGMLRDIVLSHEDYLEVKSSKPLVRLYVRLDLKRDETLANDIDYSERDDQLVGICALFQKNNPASDVRILTHDFGPMATAKTVGVKFDEIPGAWLLTPEPDEAEKRINTLQAQLLRLQKAEPAVKVRFENSQTGEQFVGIQISVYSALEDEQVNALLTEIALRFPVETDFGSKIVEEKRDTLGYALFMERKVFTPATDEAIAEYEDRKYPEWLSACGDALRNLHLKLNAKPDWPTATVWLANTGARPAENTLVTLSANGNFRIQPPVYVREEDAETESAEDEPRLPAPPVAPKGSWKTKRLDVSHFGDSRTFVRQAIAQYDSFPSIRKPAPRDPNSFYYQSRPHSPVKSFALTCQQWRHQTDEEPFELTMHIALESATTEGALQVTVQAANMTDPVVARQPVRITVQQVSALAKAAELVEKLTISARRS